MNFLTKIITYAFGTDNGIKNEGLTCPLWRSASMAEIAAGAYLTYDAVSRRSPIEAVSGALLALDGTVRLIRTYSAEAERNSNENLFPSAGLVGIALEKLVEQLEDKELADEHPKAP
jgi:hypothetical protein